MCVCVFLLYAEKNLNTFFFACTCMPTQACMYICMLPVSVSLSPSLLATRVPQNWSIYFPFSLLMCAFTHVHLLTRALLCILPRALFSPFPYLLNIRKRCKSAKLVWRTLSQLMGATPLKPGHMVRVCLLLLLLP